MERPIRATPDRLKGAIGPSVRYLGPDWLDAFVEQAAPLLLTKEQTIRIELADVSWSNLYEWASAVAYIDAFLRVGSREVHCDFVGDKYTYLATPEELIQYRKGVAQARRLTIAQNKRSEEVYRTVGFLESLTTSAIVNRPGRAGRMLYPFLGNSGQVLDFYVGFEDNPSIDLPFRRIESKEDCRTFLDSRLILNWRDAMQGRYSKSPLFHNEELWRVFCHELAVNIWEHANSPGFIVGRIVEPFHKNGKLKSWCEVSFTDVGSQLLRKMEGGFVELCVADVGHGFLQSLRRSYCEATKEPEASVDDMAVLRFAFDIHGTSKAKNQRWATERHALGRILQLVDKYGGQLTLRSGKAEVVFASTGEPFTRLPNFKGLKPTRERILKNSLSGAHFQLLLPLVPIVAQQPREKRPRYHRTLPESFRTQTHHVRGHLVPLRELLDFTQECSDEKDRTVFRDRCEKLSAQLIKRRPAEEALVLDFSDLEWTAAQFETFLYLLQPILQQRPVLLVEIKPQLAIDIRDLESRSEATLLNEEVANMSHSATGRAYGELSENLFMEAYHRVHATILGIDRDGELYIFGIIDEDVEKALLSLITKPASLEVLRDTYNISESILRGVLNNINPLFRNVEGMWRSEWNNNDIENESNRVMSRHFDRVVERCLAWRGRKVVFDQEIEDIKPDKGTEVFNLTWDKGGCWIKEFFESSRILSRDRYLDEYAQRLLYRLEQGFKTRDLSLTDVDVLAAVTAPSLLLATALHRWWPHEKRPAVADLGFYRMHRPDGDLPLIAEKGGIVIVQDVVHSGQRSDDLVERLLAQGKVVFCVLSFVHLMVGEKNTSATDVSDGWEAGVKVPRHAMMRLPAPSRLDEVPDVSDELKYWIEPRSLRPFRYSTMRQGRKMPSQDEEDNRAYVRSALYSNNGGCYFSTGHYVYGSRHYNIVIDIPGALHGKIGDKIAHWIADICEGGAHRPKMPWESPRGAALNGEVSVVLMPLHSQIYYLWPKVEALLAARGRRQPVWFLDATLFLGPGQVYRIPVQLEHQIHAAIAAAKKEKKARKKAEHPLRFLILDDATFSGHTIETILNDLLRAIDKGVRVCGGDSEDAHAAIQWIRYFAVFNQMERSAYSRWHANRSVGGDKDIRFLFEEFDHCMGIRVYEHADCPVCAEIARMERIKARAESAIVHSVRTWATARASDLTPTAIDGRQFDAKQSVELPEPIRVRINKIGNTEIWEREGFKYAHTAIRVFYELMYQSCPPGDVIDNLYAVSVANCGKDIKLQYERYRWAVFQWCFGNWSRLRAHGLIEKILEAALQELALNSGLVAPICSQLADRSAADSRVNEFIARCLERLLELEQQLIFKGEMLHAESDECDLQVVLLNRAVTAFLIQISPEARLRIALVGSDKIVLPLLQCLEKYVDSLPYGAISAMRSMYHWLSRPESHYAQPGWALRTVYELLFRGYEPNKEPEYWDHQSLPNLLSKVEKYPSDEYLIHVLQDELSLFCAAIEDIRLYANWMGADNVVKQCREIIEWFTSKESDPSLDLNRPKFYQLGGDLRPAGVFCTEFNRVWHTSVGDMLRHLTKRYAENSLHGRLEFRTDRPESFDGTRILGSVTALEEIIYNWTIEPIKDFSGSHKSIVRVEVDPENARIAFYLLTSFADAATTEERTNSGRNAKSGEMLLRPFGVLLDERWTTISDGGCQAKKRITAPMGYIEKITHEL